MKKIISKSKLLLTLLATTALLAQTVQAQDNQFEFDPNVNVSIIGDFLIDPWSQSIACKSNPSQECFQIDLEVPQNGQFIFQI